jgi:hypothetical protein
MLIDFLVRNPLHTALIWAAMYLFDFISTIRFARNYYNTLIEHFEYEGGIELNPVFERDIAYLRWFSPRFIALLIGFFLALLGIGLLDRGSFEFAAGAFLLLWVFIDLRHLRNAFLLRLVRTRPARVEGHVKQSYWLSQRLASYDAFSFALVYLLVFLGALRVFFLGGALVCALAALRQFILANRKPKIYQAG